MSETKQPQEIMGLRVKAADELRALVEMAGYSPALISEFVGMTERSIFRFTRPPETRLFLPPTNSLENIFSFLADVKEARAVWGRVASEWQKSAFKDLPKKLKAVVFDPKLVEVLEDEELSRGERADLLTLRSLLLYVRQHRAARKKTEE